MTPPVISHLAVFLNFLSNDDAFYSFKTEIWNSLNTFLIGKDLDEEIIFDDILSQLQLHLIVLNHLKCPEVKMKKNLRVTFEETEKVFCPTKLFFNDNYKTDLTSFVNSVSLFYLNKTLHPEVGHMYANHVCQVILAFKSYGIVWKLSQLLPVTNNKTSSPFRLYENYIKKWIDDHRVLTYNSISVILELLETVEDENEQSIMIEDLNLVFINFYL